MGGDFSHGDGTTSDRFLRSDRLLLRPWCEADLEPFAAMNADAAVMEYFSKTLNRQESDSLATRFRDLLDRQGYGLWALEVPDVASFIGFVGLHHETFEAPFTPCVEIGWRLARAHWGKGYATEAARGALRYGFERLGLDEIVSFTVPDNTRSRAVMERIGMTRSEAEDFDHPKLPVGHRLRRHVLYRIRRSGDPRAMG
ncbi:ribosomal-protein-alanine N-acetyltransferase [Singulisphaera sp. GP187]|nr:ribosomal-protein-alanine N-acetyltransferase [Singulisphaera sp. GP187]